MGKHVMLRNLLIKDIYQWFCFDCVLAAATGNIVWFFEPEKEMKGQDYQQWLVMSDVERIGNNKGHMNNGIGLMVKRG
jgi:hypothetical protein